VIVQNIIIQRGTRPRRKRVRTKVIEGISDNERLPHGL
jgi:hypothetical protein